MASVQHIEQLKEACGSDRLQDCFRCLFGQERADLEVRIQRIGEICDELRTAAENRGLLTAETKTLSPFHQVAGDVIEAMDETADREARMLAGLIAVLDIAREGRAEKDHHIFVMDLHDDED